MVRLSRLRLYKRARPKRTNGGFTTRALRSLPRIPPARAAGAAAGTRASAMERSSVGEKVPLVISPAGAPALKTLLVAAQHAALLEHQADELARDAGGADG